MPGERAAVSLRCPAGARGRRRAGTVAIVKGPRNLARGRYRVRAGRARTVRLRLRPVIRGRAEVTTRERDTRGGDKATRARIVLRLG